MGSSAQVGSSKVWIKRQTQGKAKARVRPRPSRLDHFAKVAAAFASEEVADSGPESEWFPRVLFERAPGKVDLVMDPAFFGLGERAFKRMKQIARRRKATKIAVWWSAYSPCRCDKDLSLSLAAREEVMMLVVASSSEHQLHEARFIRTATTLELAAWDRSDAEVCEGVGYEIRRAIGAPVTTRPVCRYQSLAS